MNGFIAGIAGGVISSLWGYISANILKITTLRYVDFAIILVYGKKNEDFVAIVFAQIIQLLFSATAGIIFAYLLPCFKEKYYFFKSMYFGGLIWFFVYAVTLLFKVPNLTIIPFKDALSNYFAAILYGLMLGITYQWLRRRKPEG